MRKETVNHPEHYGGKDNPYECIKVIMEWGLLTDFLLGNALKYIARCGKKDLKKDMLSSQIEDIEKAIWYLNEKKNILTSTFKTER